MVESHSPTPRRKLTGIEIALRAKEQLETLTGLKSDTVSKLLKDQEVWQIDVEMIELKSIPDTNDVLATYETLLDEAGDLLSYQRTQRYHRGQVK